MAVDGDRSSEALAALVLNRAGEGTWHAALTLHPYERRPGAGLSWAEPLAIPDGAAVFGAVCEALLATAEQTDHTSRLAALQHLHGDGCAVEVSAAFDDEIGALLDARS